MWRPRSGRSESTTCIACGADLDRTAAREYDKHGDRWDREGKTFEHLCKDCDAALCHQPREGLEDLLVEAAAGETADETFLRQYCAAVEERYGSVEEQ